ncbi:MAG: UDP-N-acetylmuramoyl-L-alanine--D-glutamate ligase [Gemmatimonadota bacterium]
MAVIGLGASGEAAARLAVEQGGDVYVSDSRTDDAVAARGADLGDAGIAVELGGHDLERMADADLVVTSPGIPPHAPVLRGLTERGVTWIAEPELASRFFRGALIAVTGTNGKTTTTLLVDHLLRASGIRSAAGGNVGGGLAPPASDLARLDPQPDWVVLEMSSFQLADVQTFQPDIGVVTNLSPDHLDRYESVDAYYADKARIFDNATGDSRWVLPFGDDAVSALAGGVAGRRYTFGVDAEADAFVHDGTLMLRTDGEIEEVLPRSELPLLGQHNVVNALTAVLTARLAGAAIGGITAGLGTARALPHRLDPVHEAGGVLWINDSKATNVAAARSAVASIDRPVILLLGGKDKGEAFGSLARDFAGRVRHVLVYGEVAERAESEIWAALSSGAGTAVERGGDGLDHVVARAAALAQPGDAVLLAPACSSFDQYENYEARGRHFIDLARGVA